MRPLTARLLVLLAVILFAGGCRHTSSPSRRKASPTPSLSAGALLPSPRLLVGRIVAVDAGQKFAFVELASDAPSGALAAGTELIVRTLDLQETARVQASRFVRGRTLGTKILAGQPSPGDEVVWLAP